MLFSESLSRRKPIPNPNPNPNPTHPTTPRRTRYLCGQSCCWRWGWEKIGYAVVGVLLFTGVLMVLTGGILMVEKKGHLDSATSKLSLDKPTFSLFFTRPPPPSPPPPPPPPPPPLPDPLISIPSSSISHGPIGNHPPLCCTSKPFHRRQCYVAIPPYPCLRTKHQFLIPSISRSAWAWFSFNDTSTNQTAVDLACRTCLLAFANSPDHVRVPPLNASEPIPKAYQDQPPHQEPQSPRSPPSPSELAFDYPIKNPPRVPRMTVPWERPLESTTAAPWEGDHRSIMDQNAFKCWDNTYYARHHKDSADSVDSDSSFSSSGQESGSSSQEEDTYPRNDQGQVEYSTVSCVGDSPGNRVCRMTNVCMSQRAPRVWEMYTPDGVGLPPLALHSAFEESRMDGIYASPQVRTIGLASRPPVCDDLTCVWLPKNKVMVPFFEQYGFMYGHTVNEVLFPLFTLASMGGLTRVNTTTGEWSVDRDRIVVMFENYERSHWRYHEALIRGLASYSSSPVGSALDWSLWGLPGITNAFERVCVREVVFGVGGSSYWTDDHWCSAQNRATPHKPFPRACYLPLVHAFKSWWTSSLLSITLPTDHQVGSEERIPVSRERTDLEAEPLKSHESIHVVVVNKGRNRRFLNLGRNWERFESAIEEAVSPYGPVKITYLPYDVDALTLREQADLFRKTHVLVAHAGSIAADTFFMPRGSAVVFVYGLYAELSRCLFDRDITDKGLYNFSYVAREPSQIFPPRAGLESQDEYEAELAHHVARESRVSVGNMLHYEGEPPFTSYNKWDVILDLPRLASLVIEAIKVVRKEPMDGADPSFPPPSVVDWMAYPSRYWTHAKWKQMSDPIDYESLVNSTLPPGYVAYPVWNGADFRSQPEYGDDVTDVAGAYMSRDIPVWFPPSLDPLNSPPSDAIVSDDHD